MRYWSYADPPVTIEVREPERDPPRPVLYDAHGKPLGDPPRRIGLRLEQKHGW